jgi:hypothetical protein
MVLTVSFALIRLANAVYTVLIRSTNAAALALIRLTNAAAQLPYGLGEAKGELVLRTQAERKAATATQSDETLGAGNASFRQR